MPAPPHSHGPVPRSSFASGGSAAPSSGVIDSSRASGVSAWPSSLGLATRLGHPSIPWAASFHSPAMMNPLFAVHAGGICRWSAG